MKSRDIFVLIVTSFVFAATLSWSQGTTTIPTAFIGSWIEKGDDGKQIGEMDITDKLISWEREGEPTKTFSVKDVTISEKKEMITFSSQIVIERKIAFSSGKIKYTCEALVKLSRDNEGLVVDLSGMKVEGRGSVVEFAPEIHRYKKISEK